MKQDAPRKAVIYCRVSDVKQKTNGHGLDSQEFRCREYAERKGYQVVAAFHDDISGKFSARPAFDAMVKLLLHQDERMVVLIDDTTRIARSMRAHLDLRDALAITGAGLESPTKVYVENPEDDVHEMMEAVVSAVHRRQNAKQTVNRMRARLKSGNWLFPAATGYTFIENDARESIMIRDEPVASVMAEMLEGYASGRFQTQTEAARFLEQHPQYPRKEVARQTINYMLANPIYAGHLSVSVPEWEAHLITGRHEPLISLETHFRIKARMEGRASVPARKNLNLDFPLRGALHCTCGRALMGCWSTSRNGVRHAYYLCQNKGGCEHYGKSIRRDLVEGQFAELLSSMRPRQQIFAAFRDMLRMIWDSHSADAKQKRAHLQREMKRLEGETAQFLDRVIRATAPTLITAYEERISALEDEKLVLKERIANCGRALPPFDDTFRTALDFLENPQKLWVSERYEDKRAVLKLTFAEHLTYARGDGFRTALTTSPFKVICNFERKVSGMVPLR